MLEHRARAVTHTSNREPHPDGAWHTLFGTPRFCVKVKDRFRGASRHRYRTRSPSAEIPQHVRPLLLTAPESGSDRGANPLRGRVPQATPATHPTSVNPSPFHTWRVDNRFLGDLRADGDAAGLAQDPRRGDRDGQAAAPAPPRPLWQASLPGGAEVIDHGVLAANPSTRKRAALPLSRASRHPQPWSRGSRIGLRGAVSLERRFDSYQRSSAPRATANRRRLGQQAARAVALSADSGTVSGGRLASLMDKFQQRVCQPR